jgi:hypothetical protein
MIFRLCIVKYGSLSTFPIISFVNVSFLFRIIYINFLLSEIKINKAEPCYNNLKILIKGNRIITLKEFYREELRGRKERMLMVG